MPPATNRCSHRAGHQRGRNARLDGLPLVEHADPADGRVQVAVAVPVRQRLTRRVRVKVRRASGRAAMVAHR